jgi:excisionase family DNA binding protein
MNRLLSAPRVPAPRLTKQEVAHRLGGTSVRFVDELLARRILPRVKLGRKLVRIPAKAVEDYIAAHTREAAPR